MKNQTYTTYTKAVMHLFAIGLITRDQFAERMAHARALFC